MRYTKKGQQKLVDYLYAYGAYVSSLRTNAPDPLAFEPDDFESVVVLTRKEAKVIFEIVEEAREFLWQRHRVPLAEESQKKVDDLRKRIEQAEKENATD